jgi:hypothetical protein
MNMADSRDLPGLATLHRAALLLCLLLATAMPLAQEVEPEPPAAEAEEPERVEEPPPQVESGSDDPFDYEATEQISEDLSVSFPVDI